MFEDIPTQPNKGKELIDEIKTKENKEKKEKELQPLLRLKSGTKFSIPDSKTPDQIYIVGVKYADDRIEVREEGAWKKHKFDGIKTKVMVLSTKEESHE